MSTKSIHKLINQTTSKKRKSCFEITRVAFQNLSEDDTEDDEDINGGGSNHSRNCEIFPTKEILKNSHDEVSSRTRFKVLKAAYNRGRWNCNDSLENGGDFYLNDLSLRKCCNDLENQHPIEVFHTSLSVVDFKNAETSIYSESLMIESRHSVPDLLDHQVSRPCKDVEKESSLSSAQESTEICGTLGHSSSSPSFPTVMESDVLNTRGMDASVEHLEQVEHHQESLVRKCAHHLRNNHVYSTLPSMALLNSSENISEKISKALDLAKEHVILTAHGEIEKLKDKIIQLQSTIKRLEEENMQLRGMSIQQQLAVSAVTADLIDLSDN